MRTAHVKIKNRLSIETSLRISVALLALILLGVAKPVFGKPMIEPDAQHKLVTLRDGDGQLTLRLDYNAGCRLDRVNVRGREVAAEAGVYTGVRVGDEWFTTKAATGVNVMVGKNNVTVIGIKFGPAGHEVRETWKFTTLPHRIVWQITRTYSGNETVEDMAFPEWNFGNMSTWTGGLQDNGGVVVSKYLDRTNATYGGHFGTVTFWNATSNDCLRITPIIPKDFFGAGRFSCQTNGLFSFYYAISDEKLMPKHGQSRFLRDRQDLWKPFPVHGSKVTVKFVLQALDYDKTYDRGTFVGLDGNRIRELLNTVARYGVIDSHLVGGNGWRSGYICLHEPFFAQIAAAVDSADYTANLSAALDFEQSHAIETDGRVKARWCYGPGDAMPGTYDQYGFYEAQWGYLMDSQPDYVMNVVEQFDLTGDRTWLARHKDSCERALGFLMRREIGNSGLVAMMTDSYKQHRGSDWIDIIWASYANAFVNAQLYAALNLWADAEDALNDTNQAQNYRAFAAKLKHSFNRPTSEGGFWDPTNQWYAHWRDKDGSIHGDNLVTPVNFAAIAYGLCDDPARCKNILDRIEAEMEKENLFYWPLCFFSYQPGEGAGSNFPFPKYENGDIFLSWGELGVRAYAAYDPALALKYVKNTLARHAKDGLSFQRYLRKSQQGAGADILAGNCMPIVGLYRDIYGVQPKPNRLYLDPNLTGQLNGTRLRYELRGQLYEIALNTNASSIAAGNCTVQDPHPFGVNDMGTGVQYFHGTDSDWAMSISPPNGMHLTVHIEHWPGATGAPREWTELAMQRSGKVSHFLRGLKPDATCQLYVDGQAGKLLRADKTGEIRFEEKLTSMGICRFKITSVGP
jgi:hypothetical protein